MKTLNIKEEMIEEKKSNTYRYDAGNKIRFQSEIVFIDLEKFNMKEQKNDFYDLIIKMETEEEDLAKKEIIYIYGKIDKGKIEVLKQKMEFQDKAFLMQEIYGNNSKEITQRFICFFHWIKKFFF